MNRDFVPVTFFNVEPEKEHQHDIHPYLLKEYRHRCYLVGFHDWFGEIRIFGLDRIIRIEERRDKEYIDKQFSAET